MFLGGRGWLLTILVLVRASLIIQGLTRLLLLFCFSLLFGVGWLVGWVFVCLFAFVVFVRYFVFVFVSPFC